MKDKLLPITNIKKLQFKEFIEIEVENKSFIVNSNFKKVYNTYNNFIEDLKEL
jgi:hypothetical protein